MAYLTKKEAKRLSVLKWEHIVKHNGSDDLLTDDIPEIEFLSAECGFCEKYYDGFMGGCGECPLQHNGLNCNIPDHEWRVWDNDRTKKNAQAMLDLIKKS